MPLKNTIAVLATVAFGSPLYANSCSNLDVLGTYDQHPFQETEYQIYAVGTFRIMGEKDESKQPMFNLTNIICDKEPGNPPQSSLECKFIQASVSANSEKPTPTNQIARSILISPLT